MDEPTYPIDPPQPIDPEWEAIIDALIESGGKPLIEMPVAESDSLAEYILKG